MTSKKIGQGAANGHGMGSPDRQRPASAAYWGGPKMAPDTDAEPAPSPGRPLALRQPDPLNGVRRDQAGVRLVRNRYRHARIFTDAQLAAVLREPQDGRCSWVALRALCAAGDEPMPEQPTPGLVALLGRPCVRCEVRFTESESVAFEHRVLAAGGRPAGKPPAPSYYRPNPRRLPGE